MRVCSIGGCEKRHEGLGYCAMHYQKFKKYGDPLGGRWFQSADRSYPTAHYRVRRDRGPAAAQQCQHCPEPAAEWAYDHTDPDELLGVDHGRRVPYSLDPARYMPLCVDCHRLFDSPRSSRRHPAAALT